MHKNASRRTREASLNRAFPAKNGVNGGNFARRRRNFFQVHKEKQLLSPLKQAGRRFFRGDSTETSTVVKTLKKKKSKRSSSLLQRQAGKKYEFCYTHL